MTNAQPNLPHDIGGYRVQRLIGTGGMATVYAARQTQPRRIVAVKVMRAGVDTEIALRRFKREIEILGKLSHPNIAQVYSAGTFEEDGVQRPYFVMEYIDGAKDLMTFAGERMWNIQDRLRLFVKVCAAVAHGHQRRVIHRDLKPSNILITRSGEPKVIDFGVARAIERDASKQTQATEAGRLVGTIQYMAPEQVDAMLQDIDARCDVYALGAVLYKLLTGKPPYDLTGKPVYMAAQIIRDDEIAPPSTIRSELRGDLDTIILKALEKDRDRRYRHAGELGRDIVRYLKRKPIQARPASMMYRGSLFVRRHLVAVSSALAVALVVVVATAMVIYERSQRSAPTPPPVAETIPDDVARANAPALTSQTPPKVPTDDRQAYTLSLRSGYAVVVALDPTTDRLVIGTDNGRVEVWDRSKRQRLAEAADHDGPVRHVHINGDVVVSVGDDGQLVRINATSGNLISRQQLGCETVLAAAGARGSTVRTAIACDDLAVQVFDGTSKTARRLRSSRGNVTALGFNSAGEQLVGGTERGGLYVWDATTGAVLERLHAVSGPVAAVAFIGDTSDLVVITDDGHLRLIRRAENASSTGDTSEAIPLDRDIPLAGIWRIDPGGHYLLHLDRDQRRLGDLADRRWITLTHELDTAIAILAPPDGPWAMTGGAGAVVMLPLR